MPGLAITLTTDFGDTSPYVAVMKGVILAINPGARLVDLTHQIPPQDIQHAAFFLRTAIPYFPPETLHVVVVDPGVGTDRAILHVEGQRHRLLAPDNGCWTLVPGIDKACVRHVTSRQFFRPQVSNTFHGRDIFAPVAAYLSRGLDPALLGPVVSQWIELQLPAPRVDKRSVAGEVIFVDRFGNLLTNIPAELVGGEPTSLKIGRRSLRRGFRWVKSYGEAKPGDLVALISSDSHVEVAVVQGNAAQKLRAAAGTPIRLEWKRAEPR
jgi:S-adenosylmethionine hydrolase